MKTGGLEYMGTVRQVDKWTGGHEYMISIFRTGGHEDR